MHSRRSTKSCRSCNEISSGILEEFASSRTRYQCIAGFNLQDELKHQRGKEERSFLRLECGFSFIQHHLYMQAEIAFGELIQLNAQSLVVLRLYADFSLYVCNNTDKASQCTFRINFYHPAHQHTNLNFFDPALQC